MIGHPEQCASHCQAHMHKPRVQLTLALSVLVLLASVLMFLAGIWASGELGGKFAATVGVLVAFATACALTCVDWSAC